MIVTLLRMCTRDVMILVWVSVLMPTPVLLENIGISQNLSTIKLIYVICNVSLCYVLQCTLAMGDNVHNSSTEAIVIVPYTEVLISISYHCVIKCM